MDIAAFSLPLRTCCRPEFSDALNVMNGGAGAMKKRN